MLLLLSTLLIIVQNLNETEIKSKREGMKAREESRVRSNDICLVIRTQKLNTTSTK